MFTNIQIDIDTLPKVEDVNLLPVKKAYFYILVFNRCFITLILIGILSSINFFIENSNIELVYNSLLVILIVGLFLQIIFLKLGFKYRKFALREKDIIYSKGFLQLSTTILPFNRVQHVEISKSFLERKLNLATLKIFTAGDSGSDLTISGLSKNDAHSINAYLTKLLNESV